MVSCLEECEVVHSKYKINVSTQLLNNKYGFWNGSMFYCTGWS